MLVALWMQVAQAAADANPPSWAWNLVIALVVLAFTLASAALPIAATRQWQRYWRGAALFPMLVLLIWIALIVFSRMGGSEAHQLWPLEIFAWAMLNMIYMVALMTSKRILEKADEEKSTSD